MIYLAVSTEYWRVTDKRTDRQTDRRTDGQSSCHSIVRAMYTRRAVKPAGPPGLKFCQHIQQHPIVYNLNTI